MVELDQVSKNFGDRKVLDEISLELKSGEIHGFLGPNGAGKSTTIKIILGLLRPESGSVKLFGESLSETFPKKAYRVGVLPEFPPLYEDMITEEYFEFLYQLKYPQKLSKTELNQLIEDFELQESRGRLIKNLSRGNKQKIALAQAFLGRPEIVILDEPTLGLDPENIVRVREIIKKVAKNCTVFLSSHLLNEVQLLCDRVTIINQGKIQLSRSVSELSNLFAMDKQFSLKTRNEITSDDLVELKQRFQLQFLGQEDHYWRFQGDLDDEKKSELFQFLGNKDLGVLDAHWKEVNLEQIYLKTLKGDYEVPRQ